MENTAYIGLEVESLKGLSYKLNDLLCNYQLFYMNLRGFHWNIKGDKFFELHAKFEELYNDSLEKIDVIAERIKTLGFTPTHAFSDYIEISKVKEVKNLGDGKAAVESILDSLKIIISIEREVLEFSVEANDEGTNALMSDYLRGLEKHVWMFNAYLGEK
ncbi:MAG: DNA starvation/stationary phase protection protein [Bacteroidetes bacterium]|nr:DNA starvation/stationary phase protection protein [Bacteroidota bacterium]HET6243315.1 Dps family protein [Bacteroidia bacterium]